MKCEEGDSEAQNDQASDDWFCGEKSPVTDRDKNSHLPLRSQFV